MNLIRMVRPAVCLVPLAALLLFLSPTVTLAQATQEDMGVMSSAKAQDHDSKALEKLKKLSPEEVDELDRRLAEALTLFYDREYIRALPIFQEVAGTVETMDVAFWLGSCAARAGEADLAIEKFQEMLAVDPDLHRVRLELATVYYSLGRHADARRELNTVLEARPPEPVRENIERLLASIDARTRRLYPNLRISVGIQKDTNVSSGPDHDFIPMGIGGFLGPLEETQKEVRDYLGVLSLHGNLLYDIGERRGFMWNTTGSFYNTHHFKHYKFDFLHARITTGPWWVGERVIVKFPFGYANNTYEHESLFNTWDVSPNIEYFITPQFSLRGGYSYSKDVYKSRAYQSWGFLDRTGQDNIKRVFDGSVNFYLNQRRDIISVGAAYENSSAKDPRFGYSASHWSGSYFKRFEVFDWDMEFFLRHRYTLKHFDAAALLWPANVGRRDKRHNLYAVLGRNFENNFFASLSFNYITNSSNVGLYDFNKLIYNFSVGYKF